MKTRVIFLFLTAGALCWGTAGCSNNNIDTNKVRAAFAGESDDVKKLVGDSMRDIETSNYVAAAQPLRLLGFHYKLSAPERKVLADTERKLRSKTAGNH